MNILFFITPKIDVVYICETDSIGQVMKTMEEQKYSSVPMIDGNGKYVGTLTEGDLLWGLKHKGITEMSELEQIKISEIQRKRDYTAVNVEVDMEDLINKAMNQNFVPVMDDQDNFIGIITRKNIIEYCFKKLQEYEKYE